MKVSISPLTIFFSLAVFLAAPVLAQVCPTDFDGDGSSEFTIVNIGTDQKLDWQAVSAVSGTVQGLTAVGKNGDHIILGRWRGGAESQTGVINLNTTTKVVTWKIRVNGQLVQKDFGVDGNIFVSGGDFNGNGYLDAVAIERASGKLRWKLMSDALAPGNEASTAYAQYQFGKGKDKIFFASANGLNDWFGVIQKRKDKTSLVRLFNPVTGKAKKFVIAKGKPAGQPTPVRRADGVDLLVFKKNGANKTTLLFRNMKGKTVAKAAIPATGTMIVGDFIPAFPGEEVAIQAGSSFVAYNPFTKQSAAFNTMSGIAVDEININSFSGPNGGDSGGGGSSGPGLSGCTAKNPFDGNEGFLWKPNSDTQHFAVIAMPAEYTGKMSKVETFAPNGTLIKALKYKGVGNGNRTHWQDLSMTGQNYKSQYGSVYVKGSLNSGACVSYHITNPAIRND